MTCPFQRRKHRFWTLFSPSHQRATFSRAGITSAGHLLVHALRPSTGGGRPVAGTHSGRPHADLHTSAPDPLIHLLLCATLTCMDARPPGCRTAPRRARPGPGRPSGRLWKRSPPPAAHASAYLEHRGSARCTREHSSARKSEARNVRSRRRRDRTARRVSTDLGPSGGPGERSSSSCHVRCTSAIVESRWRCAFAGS